MTIAQIKASRRRKAPKGQKKPFREIRQTGNDLGVKKAKRKK